MNEKKQICSVEKCTGCNACYNICPFEAISLEFDRMGFSHPVIKDTCKNCGLCYATCPVNNSVEKNNPQKCYAALSNIHFSIEPTSGGIASVLYQYVIESGGIGYGVSLDNSKGRFGFFRADKIREAEAFAGSKYVQADVGSIYKIVKADVQSNKKVLFIGTPCQIAGLKKYLRKEYDNLLLVDFICHGTPSQKMLFDSIGIEDSRRVQSIKFRRGREYILSFTCDATKTKNIDSYHSKFFEAFSLGKSIRQACHECQYASLKRVGDVTIGDYWGLGEDSYLYQRQGSLGGISLVLLNTERGEDWFRSIKKYIVCEERDVHEAESGNSQLRSSVPDTKEAAQFRAIYCKTDSFSKAVIKSRNLRQVLSSISILHYAVAIIRKLKD